MQLHFLQIHPTQSIYLLSHKLSMGGDRTVISSTTHAVHNVSAVNKGYKEATGRSSAERCVGNAGSIATGQAQGAGMWSDAAWSAFNPYNGGYHQAVGMISLAGLIIGEAARFRRPPRQENVAVPLSCTGHENRIVGDGIWHGTQNAASPPGTRAPETSTRSSYTGRLVQYACHTAEHASHRAVQLWFTGYMGFSCQILHVICRIYQRTQLHVCDLRYSRLILKVFRFTRHEYQEDRYNCRTW